MGKRTRMSDPAQPFRVGLIGTGRISGVYLKNCASIDGMDIVACGSLDLEESRGKAELHGVPCVMTPEEIITDPQIDAILNLTVPAAHAEVSLAALEADKHVYSEKPFVMDLTEGRRILDLAAKKGLLVGGAPDTFLGGRWQTLRKLLDRGAIGEPTGVVAFAPTPWRGAAPPEPGLLLCQGRLSDGVASLRGHAGHARQPLAGPLRRHRIQLRTARDASGGGCSPHQLHFWRMTSALRH